MRKLSTTLPVCNVTPGGNMGDNVGDDGVGDGNRGIRMLKVVISSQLMTHKNPSALMQRIVSVAKIKPRS